MRRIASTLLRHGSPRRKQAGPAAQLLLLPPGIRARRALWTPDSQSGAIVVSAAYEAAAASAAGMSRGASSPVERRASARRALAAHPQARNACASAGEDAGAPLPAPRSLDAGLSVRRRRRIGGLWSGGRFGRRDVAEKHRLLWSGGLQPAGRSPPTRRRGRLPISRRGRRRSAARAPRSLDAGLSVRRYRSFHRLWSGGRFGRRDVARSIVSCGAAGFSPPGARRPPAGEDACASAGEDAGAPLRPRRALWTPDSQSGAMVVSPPVERRPLRPPGGRGEASSPVERRASARRTFAAHPQARTPAHQPARTPALHCARAALSGRRTLSPAPWSYRRLVERRPLRPPNVARSIVSCGAAGFSPPGARRPPAGEDACPSAGEDAGAPLRARRALWTPDSQSGAVVVSAACGAAAASAAGCREKHRRLWSGGLQPAERTRLTRAEDPNVARDASAEALWSAGVLAGWLAGVSPAQSSAG
jgi:hypothetical protein